MEQFNPAILKGSKTIKCEECGSMFFTTETILQSVSKFKIGSPEDVIIPLNINRCSECGNPITEQLESIFKLIEDVKVPEANDNIRPLKRNSGLILE